MRVGSGGLPTSFGVGNPLDQSALTKASTHGRGLPGHRRPSARLVPRRAPQGADRPPGGPLQGRQELLQAGVLPQERCPTALGRIARAYGHIRSSISGTVER